MRTWICADGGGTKLLTLLVDEELGIRHAHTTGGINPNFLSRERIEAHMRESIEGAAEAARALGGTLCGAYVSMPGPWELYQALLRAQAPQATFTFVDEGRMGLLAGLCRAEGFAALSGTGSDVFYRGPGGHIEIGGWGLLLGDEGSGSAIGQRGLIAAIHASDGRGRETQLLALLDEYIEKKNGLFQTLVPTVYQAASPRSVLAGFAPYVARAADAGDGVAREIVEQAGRDMGLQLRVLIRKALAINPEALVLPATVCGGAWKGTPRFFDAFRRDVHAEFPTLELQWPLFNAIAGGAVELGFALGHDAHALRARLLETFHAYRYPVFPDTVSPNTPSPIPCFPVRNFPENDKEGVSI